MPAWDLPRQQITCIHKLQEARRREPAIPWLTDRVALATRLKGKIVAHHKICTTFGSYVPYTSRPIVPKECVCWLAASRRHPVTTRIPAPESFMLSLLTLVKQSAGLAHPCSLAQPTCTASAIASAHFTPTIGINCAATAMMYSQCSRFVRWRPTANLCIDCAQPLNAFLEGGPISRGLCPACLHELQVGCWRMIWQCGSPPCYDLADDLQCQSLVSNVIWQPPGDRLICANMAVP